MNIQENGSRIICQYLYYKENLFSNVIQYPIYGISVLGRVSTNGFAAMAWDSPLFRESCSN